MVVISTSAVRCVLACGLAVGAGAVGVARLGPMVATDDHRCTMLRASTPMDGASRIDQFIADHADLLDPLVRAIDRGEAIAPTEAQRAAMDELDAIAHQKDALWSRLAWHTDLDGALAEAKERGVPVLSLRLLGRLDESLSCANSRYFRAVLYPNAEVSRYLREHFVMHWHTVREAPVLTVDFGDGRTITQTITGNSIHYVLTPDGEVVDALPGLYTPQMFLEGLRAAERAVVLDRFASHHSPVIVQASQPPRPRPAPDAREAGALAAGKMLVEDRSVRNFVPDGELTATRSLLLAEASWRPVYGAEKVFDARARSLALSQLREPGMTTEQVDRTLATFEASARTDSARNAGELRPQVIALLADPTLRTSPTALDQRVYDAVFLSPLTDQWAGLVDPDAFAGLWAHDRFHGSPGG